LIGVAGDRSERASPISAVIIRLDRMIQYSRAVHLADGSDWKPSDLKMIATGA
jgi:hypothetical protein